MDLTRVHDARRPRRVIGAVLYGVLLLFGIGLLVWLFSAPLGVKAHCDISQYGAYMTLGALFALPAVVAYMLVPMVVDRYDPEPWWALAFAFAWGAIVATGFSGLINTSVGWAVQGELNQQGQAFAEAVVSAPFVEEFWKGALVLGIFFVLRDEFDGVVDGVIYATFVALGFACVENILYYGRAGWTQLNRTNCNETAAYEAVVATFVVRGILSPWGHPLYTSMTGIGFGIARETNRTWLKIVAPMLGYGAAVVLHAIWNGSALLSQVLRIPIITITLVLYLFFVALFSVVMIVLVAREGRILRAQLRDEVLLGTLTAEELAIVGSPIGRLRAMFKWGVRKGPRFVRAAATLAMKKWHTGRAAKGRKLTMSADFIMPLRQEIAQIRSSLGLRPTSFALQHSDWGAAGALQGAHSDWGAAGALQGAQASGGPYWGPTPNCGAPPEVVGPQGSAVSPYGPVSGAAGVHQPGGAGVIGPYGGPALAGAAGPYPGPMPGYGGAPGVSGAPARGPVPYGAAWAVGPGNPPPFGPGNPPPFGVAPGVVGPAIGGPQPPYGAAPGVVGLRAGGPPELYVSRRSPGAVGPTAGGLRPPYGAAPGVVGPVPAGPPQAFAMAPGVSGPSAGATPQPCMSPAGGPPAAKRSAVTVPMEAPTQGETGAAQVIPPPHGQRGNR